MIIEKNNKSASDYV